jgi:glutamate decarboxylase
VSRCNLPDASSWSLLTKSSAQYYNLIHLGFTGYQSIMESAMANARLLSKSLEATGWYTCVSDIHRKLGHFNFNPTEDVRGSGDETSADYNAGLPVVAFRLSDDFKRQFPHVCQASVSTLMRVKQYIIPNYPLPPGESGTEILRVVVRESMSRDLLDRLISDLCQVTQTLLEGPERDLAFLSKSSAGASTEQQEGARTETAGSQGQGGKRPMTEGVHRTVC